MDNSQTQTQALAAAVIKLFRPLVRVLMRNGMSYGAFADLAKRVYVDVAMQEFDVPGRKQTVSRASIITGLSRKEVSRVMNLNVPDDAGAGERYNRAARVISAWVREARFQNAKGRPAVLPVEGASPSFSELVKEFSGDVPTRAILDELVRVGAVEHLEEGRIRLCARSYIPSSGEIEKLGILGTDVAGLIATIDHNLDGKTTQPMFQRKVFYDNLPDEAIEELRAMTEEHGQALIETLDRWMAQHDRDTNPKVSGTGRKPVGIGVYYFEEAAPQET